MSSFVAASAAFSHDRFLARRKVLTLVAPKFYFYDPNGNVIAFTKQKAFKLREDIRVYTDESMSRELLRIKARKVLDFSSAYDVEDAATGQKVGALRRRGWKSLVRDEWIILDAMENEIGRIHEDSALMATIRRWLTDLIPQNFTFVAQGKEIGHARQNFNPFVLKLQVDLTPDTQRVLDRRLAAAAIVLLLAVEGRQG